VQGPAAASLAAAAVCLHPGSMLAAAAAAAAVALCECGSAVKAQAASWRLLVWCVVVAMERGGVQSWPASANSSSK
jgi:hypothetical protein